MRAVMEAVFDKSSTFEMGRKWGRVAITAFARLDGWPVAVLASDPTYLGGSWEALTSQKVKRFVELAEKFRLPVVHLVDNPGFMIGLDAERTGTIRYGVEAMNAVYKATVPWASLLSAALMALRAAQCRMASGSNTGSLGHRVTGAAFL